MGTAQYLSPEQAQGRPVTEASDLYSVGVVLYELLTGRAPFSGDSPVAVALQHVNQPAPSPREVQPSIPPALEAVVMKALAKDPAERYTDADSFIKALEGVEARVAARARWTPRARRSTRRSASRRCRAAAVAAAQSAGAARRAAAAR